MSDQPEVRLPRMSNAAPAIRPMPAQTDDFAAARRWCDAAFAVNRATADLHRAIRKRVRRNRIKRLLGQ